MSTEDRTETETRKYAVGWIRRRLSRTIITSASLLAIAWHHGGVDSWADQAALAGIVVVFVFDIVYGRRELARARGGAPEGYLALADRELTYVKWAELTEYVAAIAVASRLIHRPLDLFEEVAVAALVTAGLVLRFGLGRAAKSKRDQLRFLVQPQHRAV